MYKEGTFNIVCIYHLRFSCLQMKDAILFFNGQMILEVQWFLLIYYKRIAFCRMYTHSLKCSGISRFI